jgi:hypothetical protein
LAEHRGKIDLVLLPHNPAEVVGDRILAERLALAHALAVSAHGVVLVLQAGAQHLLGLRRQLGRHRSHRVFSVSKPFNPRIRSCTSMTL